MGQICSRRTSRLLVALLLSGLVKGWGQSQAPTPPAPHPTPPASQAPTVSPTPPGSQTPATPPPPAASKPATPQVEAPEPPDKVVLKVGDRQFTKADMDALIEDLPTQTQQAIAAQGKKQFGDYYALSVMLSKQAKAEHLDQTPEFARRVVFQRQVLEAQAEMNQLSKVSPEDIQQYYDAHADTYDEILVRQIVVRKKPPEPKPNTEKPLPPTPPPTVRLSWVGSGDSTVRANLEKNPQVTGLTIQNSQADFKFAGSDEELSAILSGLISAGVKVLNFNEAKGARPPGLMGSAGLAPDDAKARAEAIRKELMAGADINKLTDEFKPPDVTIEREARKVRRGGMRADLEKVAFALKDGEVSEPVDINSALIIFQVTGHSRVDLKDATPEIERKLRQTKADSAMAEVKKNNTVWMDDQYFAPPARPQEIPKPIVPGVRPPPQP